MFELKNQLRRHVRARSDPSLHEPPWVWSLVSVSRTFKCQTFNVYLEVFLNALHFNVLLASKKRNWFKNFAATLQEQS